MTTRRHALAGGGAAVFLLLALPPVRGWLEASMTAHMLVQIPLLAATGFALHWAIPERRREALRAAAGGPLPFLLTALFASAYWMLPRALDAALLDGRAELAKFLSLPLLVGWPLALAWERLGLIGRGFVWTNFISMLAVLGWLYLAAPMRVCNGYLVLQQHDAGMWMIRLSLALFLWWLGSLFVGATQLGTAMPATATAHAHISRT
ncbi:MAG: hypothetical protein ACOZCP_03325 [Pseudomonadota bacterium]